MFCSQGTKYRPDLDTIEGGTFLLGNARQLYAARADQLSWWNNIRQNQKDPSKAISLTVPGLFRSSRIIDVQNEPANVEYILKTAFTDFEKPSIVSSIACK